MENKKIWILQEDPGCRFLLQNMLKNQYETFHFSTLSEFIKAYTNPAKEPRPDLLLADLKLSDGNFLHFLSSTPENDLSILPFIVISTLDDLDVLRFCFHKGAKDFFLRPLKKNELLVKIERILKSQQFEESPLSQVDMAKPSDLSFASQPNIEDFQELTTKEAEILSLFLSSNNRRLTRQEIVNFVWQYTPIQSKTLDVHLFNLRKKILKRKMHILTDGPGKWVLKCL